VVLLLGFFISVAAKNQLPRARPRSSSPFFPRFVIGISVFDRPDAHRLAVDHVHLPSALLRGAAQEIFLRNAGRNAWRDLLPWRLYVCLRWCQRSFHKRLE